MPMDRKPKTMQDLLDKLLALPEAARKCELCTYHMGNYPTVTDIEVNWMGVGRGHTIGPVEVNLSFPED